MVKLLLIAAVGVTALWGEVDARELVKKSLANYQRSWRAALKYSYTEQDVEHKAGGRVVSVSEVTTIEGTPYERLISKDGHPLSESEKRKEEQKYEKTVAQRQNESPAQRQKRIADYEKQRSFLKDVPEAFNFKLLGEENYQGRPAYVVECTPNPKYEPHNTYSRIFQHIHAKLWIDKQDVQWAKAEANVTDTISFGFFLARIGKDARILMEQMRLNSELWVTKKISVNGNARIMVLKNRSLAEEITYSNYRPAKLAADKLISSQQPSSTDTASFKGGKSAIRKQ